MVDIELAVYQKGFFLYKNDMKEWKSKPYDPDFINRKKKEYEESSNILKVSGPDYLEHHHQELIIEKHKDPKPEYNYYKGKKLIYKSPRFICDTCKQEGSSCYYYCKRLDEISYVAMIYKNTLLFPKCMYIPLITKRLLKENFLYQFEVLLTTRTRQAWYIKFV